MDDKEIEVQKALGQMREFEVEIRTPIKGYVTIRKRVLAVSPETAVENVQKVIEITPESVLQSEVARAARTYSAHIATDESQPSEMTAKDIHKPQDVVWQTSVTASPLYTSGYMQVADADQTDPPGSEEPSNFLDSDNDGDNGMKCNGGG